MLLNNYEIDVQSSFDLLYACILKVNFINSPGCPKLNKNRRHDAVRNYNNHQSESLQKERKFTASLNEGGIGIFGFAVLAIFLDRFFGFCAKKLWFSVLVFIAVCGFSVF